MAHFETPDVPQPKTLPQLMVGAASPLWAYYGAAAAGGVAFWWMTRWARPVNLEAMFAGVVPVLEVAEAIAEVPPSFVEAAAELAVEAAPPMPLVTEVEPELAAASDAPEPDPEATTPEPRVEAASEPIVQAASEPMAESEPELAAEAAAEPHSWEEPVTSAGFEPPAAESAPKARKAKAAPAPEASREA